MKQILILGGTQFIGRNLVELLLKNNEYSVTLFNRNKTGSNLFPEVNRILGDRETEAIEQISKHRWNIVIDLSCYYPKVLQSTLNALSSIPEHYILISSCSAYNNEQNKNPLKSEQTPLLACSADQSSDRSNSSYGQRKAECDRILISAGIPYSILRPALVYGKHDHTDRFYYWLYQVKNSKKLLLPNGGKSRFSLTYVEDLVQIISTLIERGSSDKSYNAISHPQQSINEIVKASAHILHRKHETIHAPAAFLKKHEINQWTDMPLWIDGDHFTYSNKSVVSDLKLTITDFHQSVQHTINYYSTLKWPTPTYGMTEKTRNDLINLLS